MGKVIGRRIGAAEATGGAGGNFSLDDHYWLNKRHSMVADPGRGIDPFDPGGHTATGGIVSDYTTPPGAIYRAHVFTGSGTFDITALSPTYPAHVEYLIIGGGGGGGSGWSSSDIGGGGGGAGGYLTNYPGDPSAAPSTNFPVSASPGLKNP